MKIPWKILEKGMFSETFLSKQKEDLKIFFIKNNIRNPIFIHIEETFRYKFISIIFRETLNCDRNTVDQFITKF